MAKKKEDTEVKEATKKKTAAKTKTTTKETTEEKTPEVTNISPEANGTQACQQMLSSIIDWSMDALMYQNILTVSRKLIISIEEAAKILDVNPETLPALAKVHMVLSASPDKKTVLGRYSDRIL